ncbi:MAG: hypothetical protein Q9220_004099 [cf. Caloplaca sp. 1 TL-2023]
MRHAYEPVLRASNIISKTVRSPEPISSTISTSSPPSLDQDLPEISEILLADQTSQIEPHLGYLKELGLDYGWGPTAFAEWVLEHVHVLLGTPWWASIPIALLAVRALVFKIYTGAADNSARLQVIKPHLKDVQARMQIAKENGDTTALMQQSQEMRSVYAVAGIKTWRFAAPLIQVPLGYGFFRLTKGLSQLPVPGFEDGGLLWFRDLTLSDPFFILPAWTGVATYFMFKLGGEMGNSATISPKMMTIFQYVLPVMSAGIMCVWPAGMQMTFAFTSLMALLQAYLFKQPWFRTLWGIHPLLPPVAPNSGPQHRSMVVETTARTVPEPDKGFLESATSGVRGTISELKEKGSKFIQSQRKKPTGRRSAAQNEEAKRYEERRRREIEQVRHSKKSERRR